MLRFELHELLFVYTGLCLAVILLGAIAHNILRNRRERLALRDIRKCQLCSFEFRAAPDADLSPCPACGAPVRREQLTRL